MFSGELHVPDDRAPDEAVLDCHLGKRARSVFSARAHLTCHPRTICGCLASSRTLILSRRMLRNLQHHSDPHEDRMRAGQGRTTYWSTDLRVPVIESSFFSSTVTR